MLDTDKQATEIDTAEEVGTDTRYSATKFEPYANIPNFATGELKDGAYAIGNGVRVYYNGNTLKGVISDDGTRGTATPGSLADGQYNHVTDLVVYGAQNKVNGETQSVRFVIKNSDETTTTVYGKRTTLDLDIFDTLNNTAN